MIKKEVNDDMCYLVGSLAELCSYFLALGIWLVNSFLNMQLVRKKCNMRCWLINAGHQRQMMFSTKFMEAKFRCLRVKSFL